MSRLQQAVEATRQGNKARIALAGPTGSGKSRTALEIAASLTSDGGSARTILGIDTERNSLCLYSDKVQFKALDWRPPYDPTELARDVLEASSEYEVVMVDSFSHFYKGEGGMLSIVDAAAARASNNTFSGWKQGDKAHMTIVEAMLQADSHVIVTMRSKMEYILETDKNGKQTPRKVGMAPVQRDGVEYEFTVIGELDMEHNLLITKSRCDVIDGRMFTKDQSRQVGATVKSWLDDNEEAPRPTEGTVTQLTSPLAKVQAAFAPLDVDAKKRVKDWWLASKLVKGSGWPGSTFQALVEHDPARIGAVLTAIEVCATGVSPDPLGEEEQFDDEPKPEPMPEPEPVPVAAGPAKQRTTRDGKSNKPDDVLTEAFRERGIPPPERDRRIAAYFEQPELKKLSQLNDEQKWQFFDHLVEDGLPVAEAL